ncbi:MAG: sensor domain-containing diguanylate cyclase, partial [Thauera sp.]|nr:sensor domain-containing diguanylate cyclase [Thauera sp.]
TPHFVTTLDVEFGGRTWVARFSSTPFFESDAQSVEAPLILITGVTVGLMLFAVIHGNALYRRRMSIAAARLAQSRDDFRMLVESMPGVVFRTRAGPPWTVIHVSRGTQDIFDKPPEYFIKEGHTIGEFVHPDDRDRVHDIVQAAIASRTPYEVEFRVRNRLRGLRWVIARGQPNIDRSGRAKWVDGLIFDITERRAAEAAIRNLAFIDALTQLPNRRFLMDRLRQGMANSDRKQHFNALLFIDLDHFKDVNDKLGHDAGDALLIEVANRLKNSVREGDTVVRLGGDEFVVMLEDLGGSQHEAQTKTAHIADKVLVALNRPHEIGEHAVTTTPSIGYTTFRGQEVSAEELLRRADRAMYTAKEGGRNQICSLDAA